MIDRKRAKENPKFVQNKILKLFKKRHLRKETLKNND